MRKFGACKRKGGNPSKDINKEMRENLWINFFAHPSKWWDTRFNKKDLKYPDFKQKGSNEALWIEDRRNPAWVKGKLGAIESDVGLRSCSGLPSISDIGAATLDYNRMERNIASLCEKGQLNEALKMVDLLMQKNIRASVSTYTCLLKECSNMKAIAIGKQVHDYIARSELESNIFLDNRVIDMYSKCGNMVDARKVFDNMPKHDIYSWNIIISAYAKHGQGKEALSLFEQMQQEVVKPDRFTYISVLKACANPPDLKTGKQIHCIVEKNGLEKDVFVGNILVDMYAKCGSIEEAWRVFDGIRERDVVSWSTMIAGYAQHGYDKEALELFDQMQCEGVEPNEVTFVSVLKACANMVALERGRQVHAMIKKTPFEREAFVGSALLDMYAKCGSLEDAWHVFNEMRERDVVSWSAMIVGCAHNGNGKEAFKLFDQMQQEGVKPDRVTFVGILKACVSLSSLELGKHVHSCIKKSGLETDVSVASALVDMYAKCGSLYGAQQVFTRIREQNVVLWNAMIAGYANNGHSQEAFALLEQMQREGMMPDRITFVGILKACDGIGDLEQGKGIHDKVGRMGFDRNAFVVNALIDMYARCGGMQEARLVFDKMHERDLVSWNTMITGYARHGQCEEAVTLLKQMQQEGMKPDEFTFVSILKAYASLSALEQGKEVHAKVKKMGFDRNAFVANTLVDMYAKCGSIRDARCVFDEMCDRDLVSWNVMIAGYAQHGKGKEAIALFEQMQREGLKPDEVTYTSVLSACSHAGLVDECYYVFDSMRRYHDIIPKSEHYACIVDVLGKMGRLIEAEEFINKMPIQPDAVVWTSAYQKYLAKGIRKSTTS